MVLEKLNDEVSSFLSEEEFENVYIHATNEPHNCLYIDKHPNKDKDIIRRNCLKTGRTIIFIIILWFYEFEELGQGLWVWGTGTGKTNALIDYLSRTSGELHKIIIVSFSTLDEPLYHFLQKNQMRLNLLIILMKYLI